MISSFFGKTQPIHYIILLGFIFIFFWVVQLLTVSDIVSVSYVLPNLLHAGILLMTIYLADVMAKRGKMTDQSAYFLLFITLQCLLFPQTLANPKGIWAQFFLLLAIQRLLDAKNLKNIKHKVFDGALFICIASLFCAWALLFFILVFFTVNTYAPKSFKTWLSAVAGILTFMLLAYFILLLIDDGGYVVEHYRFKIDFQRLRLKFTEKLDFKVLAYILLVIIFGVIDFVKYSKKGGGKIILFRFMLLYFTIALMVNLLDTSEGSYLILAFIPAAIFLSNYVQTIKKARFKESILAAFLVVGMVLALFEFLV
ncbi:DUF6427 family protein [Allomuricauda sp. d1]|uniref:DUF6427 family protein n=1 Tax=Allomuricauda sp. d1 TaxID=3136725 RepID=UPI0031DDB156